VSCPSFLYCYFVLCPSVHLSAEHIMSMSSSVLMSHKSSLLLPLVLAFLMALCSMASADYMQDRFTVQNSAYATKDVSGGLIDVLDRTGVLPIIKNLVPEIHDLLEKAEHLFHFMEKDRHAHDLNKILGHIRDTWARALDEMMASRRASDLVDVNGFHAFLAKYQVLLDRAVHNDRELDGSDVVQFMAQLEHLFRALESAYAVVFFGLESLNIPIKLNWYLFSQSKMVLKMLPTNLFDPEMLGELMRTPREMMDQFTRTFEELFEQLIDSPVGQYVPLIVNMIQNMSAKQHHNQNREDL